MGFKLETPNRGVAKKKVRAGGSEKASSSYLFQVFAQSPYNPRRILEAQSWNTEELRRIKQAPDKQANYFPMGGNKHEGLSSWLMWILGKIQDLKSLGLRRSCHPLGAMAVMSSNPNTSARDVLNRCCAVFLPKPEFIMPVLIHPTLNAFTLSFIHSFSSQILAGHC